MDHLYRDTGDNQAAADITLTESSTEKEGHSSTPASPMTKICSIKRGGGVCTALLMGNKTNINIIDQNHLQPVRVAW